MKKKMNKETEIKVPVSISTFAPFGRLMLLSVEAHALVERERMTKKAQRIIGMQSILYNNGEVETRPLVLYDDNLQAKWVEASYQPHAARRIIQCTWNEADDYNNFAHTYQLLYEELEIKLNTKNIDLSI